VRLTLYGRRECHLCEDMARELTARGVEFTEADVDAEPSLRAKYGGRVPVLADPRGREICHGWLDPVALRRALDDPTA
jgi:hypothetical protein